MVTMSRDWKIVYEREELRGCLGGPLQVYEHEGHA